MDKEDLRVINSIFKKLRKINWVGWRHNSRKIPYLTTLRHPITENGILQIVFSGRIRKLKIVIRLRYNASEDERPEFDPQKHHYWIEVVVENIITTNGVKVLKKIEGKKGDESVGLLLELFYEIYGLAKFTSRSYSRRKNRELRRRKLRSFF